MSSVATGGTGTSGKQGGVPFLDNSSDDDTGKNKTIYLIITWNFNYYNPS
jgi:hypothetical protein